MRSLILLLVLMVLGMIPFQALAQPLKPGPQDAALLKQVSGLLQGGQYAQALDLLREHLAGRDQPPPVLFQALGNALYLSDDLAGAYEAYGRALEHDPDNPALCRNQALAAYGLEHFAESAPLFERAYELNETKPDIGLLYQAAASWMYADRAGEAARVLDRAWPLLVKTGPDWPDMAWLKLNALVRTRAGQHDKGVRAICQALRLQPGNQELWLLLADTETLGDRYGRAAAALEAALRLGSHDGTAKLAEKLAGAYAGAGLPFLAARSLEHAGSPDAKTLDRLAGLYLRSGRPSQALRVLEQAQKLAPRAERTKRMALVCYQYGMHEQAMDLFQRYLQAVPGDDEVRMLLARAAMTISDIATARQALLAVTQDSAYGETAQDWFELLDNIP